MILFIAAFLQGLIRPLLRQAFFIAVYKLSSAITLHHRLPYLFIILAMETFNFLTSCHRSLLCVLPGKHRDMDIKPAGRVSTHQLFVFPTVSDAPRAPLFALTLDETLLQFAAREPQDELLSQLPPPSSLSPYTQFLYLMWGYSEQPHIRFTNFGAPAQTHRAPRGSHRH